MSAIGIVENGKFKQFADSTPNIGDTPITFEQATELANVEPGDSMSAALGKLSKLYAELEGKAAFYPVTTGFPVTEEGSLMDAKTVTDQLENIEMESDGTPSKIGWYRILSISTTQTNKVQFGGGGRNGFISISRLYEANNNESYLLSYTSVYGENSIHWNCLNSYVNNQIIDKIRWSHIPGKTWNLEIHYKGTSDNNIRIRTILNTGDVDPEIVKKEKLVAVDDNPEVISEYNLPVEQDVEPRHSWRNLVQSYGNSWLQGLLNSITNASDYTKVDYDSASSHEGLAIVYKRTNSTICGGILIIGANEAGNVFLIRGIPNNINSWEIKRL